MKNNRTDLCDFLLMLKNENELVRVNRDVNAEYEIAAGSTL
jgi:3-polyprenyl-4-hydroxybenzoate decarboxylase